MRLGNVPLDLKTGLYGEYRTRKYETRDFFYNWNADNNSDGFDTDYGFSGKVQFGLSVRDPKIADGSQSNGFESDNCADGTAIDPYTTATFSNMTFLGPKFFDKNFQNTTDYITGGSMNPNNGSSLGKFQTAMHIRRNSRLNCYNSLALGWPVGLILDNEKGDTQGAATKKLMRLNNNVFAGMTITGSDYNKIYEDALYDYQTKKADSSKPSRLPSLDSIRPGGAWRCIARQLFLMAQIGGVPTLGAGYLHAHQQTNCEQTKNTTDKSNAIIMHPLLGLALCSRPQYHDNQAYPSCNHGIGSPMSSHHATK